MLTELEKRIIAAIQGDIADHAAALREIARKPGHLRRRSCSIRLQDLCRPGGDPPLRRHLAPPEIRLRGQCHGRPGRWTKSASKRSATSWPAFRAGVPLLPARPQPTVALQPVHHDPRPKRGRLPRNRPQDVGQDRGEDLQPAFQPPGTEKNLHEVFSECRRAEPCSERSVNAGVRGSRRTFTPVPRLNEPIPFPDPPYPAGQPLDPRFRRL